MQQDLGIGNSGEKNSADIIMKKCDLNLAKIFCLPPLNDPTLFFWSYLLRRNLERGVS